MVASDYRQTPTLLYLAHLGWDHVWQRPQQLMTRFAARCPVIYVNPPEMVDDADEPHLQEQQGIAGVRVFNPVFPGPAPSGTEPGPVYENFWLSLLPQTLALAGGGDVILWVSSPRADY